MISRVDRSPVAQWWWTIDRWFLAAFMGVSSGCLSRLAKGNL